MGKKALRKDFYIEIKNTFGRFMSIFLIVALGVAFFSGIRSTEPDMKLSGDRFYDDSNLMDIRILSTLGLTNDDVIALEKVAGVKEACGGYSADVLSVDEENQRVIKLYSYQDSMNQVVLKSGRLPENSSECLADAGFMEVAGLKIGDVLTLKSGDDTDLSEILIGQEYTITGSCTSSYYLSRNKGSSSIGNGTVDGFLILPKGAFALDVFTEIYLTVEGAIRQNSYEKDYEDNIKLVMDRIEDQVQDDRIQARYTEIMEEATGELEEAKEKFNKEEKKAQNKLKEAEDEINDGKKELKKGEKELKENEDKIADGQKELKDSERELALARKELQKGKEQLSASKNEYWDGVEQYEKGVYEYEQGISALEQGKQELKEQKEMLQYIEDPEDLAEAETLIAATEGALLESEAELSGAKKQLDATKKQLDIAKAKIDEGSRTLTSSEKQITEGDKKLAEGKQELLANEKKIQDAKKELSDAQEELKKGEQEYLDAKEEAEEKLEEARLEIEDAEHEISKIEEPEWFILNRNSLQANVEFGQDAEKIGAIGKVFPAIFFLVAALVSLTTMTRMVEEQRTQIGTLKALGYSKGSIASKYLLYGLLASLGGSIVGGIIGGRLFPYVIISAYKIMYENLEIIVTPLIFSNFLVAMVLAVVCVTAATILACYKELAASPAQLMRPAAPKQGKRVFLEKIPFIWKRLNFTGKSTVRNLIRYKKRFFMTIFGIGGCMALMLVGYGVRDSITSVVGLQYGEIRKYDGIAALKNDAKQKDIQKAVNYVAEHEFVLQSSLIYETAVDASNGEIEKSAHLTVFDDSSKAGDYIEFRNRTNKETYTIDSSTVIITEKLAKLLKVSEGDSIYLKEDEATKIPVTIGAVVENYVMHYIFMSKEMYENLYQEKPEYNEVVYLKEDMDKTQEEIFTKDLLTQKAIASNYLSTDAGEDFEESMGNLDVVILILILSAGGLAFIVLYNLNNINITERKRELATIKVLGFYDMEVSEYVFRENIMLTIIGIIFGVLFGIILHRYVILTAEIDMVMFGRNIAFMSFIKSILYTALFSFIINVTMHFKLKKIDMASSLKSVE